MTMCYETICNATPQCFPLRIVVYYAIGVLHTEKIRGGYHIPSIVLTEENWHF
ncbi:hypothetical protein HanXRQr2_Chr01g0006231 [Helianthus annuus]|uniref:Uncharacterized protein n=1 Tax=Helianthus annuus TaxID=4232 RepID=A0A9K3P3B4_HELAN|nr:hypothetical protein HanXRQr2_Chr01g0006231 [Helianthus annuus]